MATTSEAMGFIGRTGRSTSVLATDWRAPDGRRILQLALATVWLLDAVLQFQPYMFTKAFGNQMIAGAAARQSGRAGPPDHLGRTRHRPPRRGGQHHLRSRPTGHRSRHRLAPHRQAGPGRLGGLGPGRLVDRRRTGRGAHPHLQPTQRCSRGGDPLRAAGPPSLADRASGHRRSLRGRPSLRRRRRPGTVAASLGQPGLRRPAGRQPVDAGSARSVHLDGQRPTTLAVVSGQSRRPPGGRERSQFSIVLAAILGLIAIGTFLPVLTARLTLVLAVALSLIIWVVGQGFGDVFSGSGTDPNTGPLLILLAAAFWPRRAASPVPASEPAEGRALSLDPSGS